MLTEPNLLCRAVLFRALVPFVPEFSYDLRAVSTLLAAGRRDRIVPAENTVELARMFEAGGARLSIHWHDGGHELAQDDFSAAKKWVENGGK